MESTLHVATAWLVMTAVAAVFAIALPLIAGGIARRKLTIGWRYFWFGALVFLVFQLLTRVPAVLVLQQRVLAPLLSYDFRPGIVHGAKVGKIKGQSQNDVVEITGSHLRSSIMKIARMEEEFDARNLELVLIRK